MDTEIIELGEVRAGVEPSPGRSRPVRGLRPLAAVIALLLTGALGAAAPMTPMFTQLADVALGDVDGPVTGGVDVAGDLLLVRNSKAVSAYDMNSGALRWRLPASAGRGRDIQVAAQVPDVLVINEDFADGSTSSAAVDVHTGAVRWSTRQYVWVIGEYALDSPPIMMSAEPGGELSAPAPTEMIVRDLSTGRVRWVLQGTPYAAVDEGALEAWSVSERGEFTVRDLRDGRVLRTGTAAFPPGRPVLATVYGGMLVLSAILPTGQHMEARYDTRTLRGIDVSASLTRFACGDYLCEVADDGGTSSPLAVLDRDTLTVRYRLAPHLHLLPSAQGAITVRTDSALQLGATADRLIDLADGRTLLDLEGWRVQLSSDRSRDALLLRSTASGIQLSASDDGTVRRQDTRTELGRYQVARIEDGQVRLLGTLPPRLNRCFHTRQRIACVYDGDRLGVWSVAASAY
ncbi:PQQ-binding-like beta-propeller repeat protein [Catellatospora aurea]|uniref:PQQ-binding-like beta-propeller repeat protein n=1 Tax=Catellatospora aurea TaxID=1337874 RepID=A0ABW2GY48_9ACTN